MSPEFLNFVELFFYKVTDLVVYICAEISSLLLGQTSGTDIYSSQFKLNLKKYESRNILIVWY